MSAVTYLVIDAPHVSAAASVETIQSKVQLPKRPGKRPGTWRHSGARFATQKIAIPAPATWTPDILHGIIHQMAATFGLRAR